MLPCLLPCCFLAASERALRGQGGTAREHRGRTRGVLVEHRRAKREKLAKGEHERAVREHGGAGGEHEGATREHMDETGLSGRAKRRDLSQRLFTYWPQLGAYIYIYII